MPAPLTHLTTFARDASTWPKHKRDKKARDRERKTVARKAQAERDAKQTVNPYK